MHSSVIGKIEKANRYARELDRITIDRLSLTFRGDNDTHRVSLESDPWQCNCHYFESLEDVRPRPGDAEDPGPDAERGRPIELLRTGEPVPVLAAEPAPA